MKHIRRASARPVVMSLGAALALAGTACRSEPANPEELFTARSLGTNYLERGRLPEAEAQFKKIVALAPKESFGYANLGLTYLQAGRFDEAEDQLRRARKLDPANADVGLMLAKIHALTGRAAEARMTLDHLLTAQPRDARVPYALAALEAQDSTRADGPGYVQRLRETLVVVPANLAVQLDLAAALVRRGEADSAIRHLEDVRRLRPEPPAEAKALLETTIELLGAGKLAEARPSLERFVHLMELTAPYQAALKEVKWYEGPIAGRADLAFAPQSVIQLRATGRLPTLSDSVRFTDATGEAGLPDIQVTPRGQPARESAPAGVMTALAVGDFNGDGADDVFGSFWSAEQRRFVSRLYLVERWRSLDITERSRIALPVGATDAAVGDYDNDGWLDLFVIGTDQRGYLLRNNGSGQFEDATARSGTADARGARKALFVDLDHDGDLDLLLVGGERNRVYRNNLDGTFTEAAAGMKLTGHAGARDVAFADFDDDGRIDLLITTEQHGVALYRNGAARRVFEDATAASGLPGTGGFAAAAVADYDNDGLLDVLLTRVDGGGPELWRGHGDVTFERDPRSATALQSLSSMSDARAEFADVDNDGWLDLVVVGTPRAGTTGMRLLRNDRSGRYRDGSGVLPAARSGTSIASIDVDKDGDLDLLVGSEGNVRLLANEGGNSNLSMQVTLVGLRTGSGKNNDFGIGSKLELRSGELHQTRVVTGRVTHFGLGSHLKGDVLRVEWPNGVPQTIYFPGTDQDVLELEMLKGSCPFLYAWDGKRFRFVTDVMWRSALGMPLGLMGSTGAFAPAGASQEYLRIPGNVLRPRDGRYVLQLTEELWETAYVDEVKLLAVDHPDSVDVFVNERFVPPGPVALRLHHVVRPRPPVTAIDDRGDDVLGALRERDDVYVSNLVPTRYQGLVEPHDVILDLGEEAGRPGTFLFLRGWIYPTDASINVALSQQSAVKPRAPSLEVRDAKGRWKTAVADIGFPSGKDKTIAVDLAGKFRTADHRVRIRTNMQIYWDQAFVAFDHADSPVKVTSLAPVSSDLHPRGYSRVYRKGGRYGPYWFAYDDVSHESPWRPIEGTLTRFGDVLPLLGSADDMYVIMGPGDEATVEFDAVSAGDLPPGWKRDFLLYTDGWVKDSDLNTAFGNTVGPLPFHAMRAYPYARGEAYPTDSAHQQYLREYNTRPSAQDGRRMTARVPQSQPVLPARDARPDRTPGQPPRAGAARGNRGH